MKVFTASLLIAALATSACNTTGASAGKPAPKINPEFTVALTGVHEWKTMDDVRKALGSKVKITGTTVDLQKGEISGKKLKHPSNSQDEGAIGVIIKVPGLTIQNGYITDIPGGIIIRERDVTLKGLTFTKIGEDAVSTQTNGGQNTTIINSMFFNDKGDKTLQFNGAQGLTISRCYITGGITGIRMVESSSKKDNVMITTSYNEFEMVPTAHNVSAPKNGKTKVSAIGNKYTDVKERWNTAEGVTINEQD